MFDTPHVVSCFFLFVDVVFHLTVFLRNLFLFRYCPHSFVVCGTRENTSTLSLSYIPAVFILFCNINPYVYSIVCSNDLLYIPGYW